MNTLLQALKGRNAILYWFGLICLIGGLVCIGLSFVTTRQVLGINAFIKPTKFCVSIWIFCWTMACFLYLLNRPRTVAVYSWMVVVVMTIELAVIIGQAAQGKLSHFNVTSIVDGVLFSFMGIAITTFTAWTGYIGYLFFITKPTGVPATYLWGIRFGILLFVIFAFEGGMMASRLAHTVGAPDGGPGLPGVNWSTGYGDLRVAHFFGMHALQLLPLYGYFLAKQPRQVVVVSIAYGVVISALLVQALWAKPLLLGLHF
ncbi:hypothetical protein [Spirosoma oryzicola]|uniref:hypothetical protein n=1 Tax=Spirosoma oryzicola TaxID=2898794 RepID=UPI001E3CFEEE|nr:hypothetical protein [Spirosoma oryzicola]UHG90670.1 hypothetical protein LQ777_20795 [Spirosoma oryzicola]